jgi:hypothetical protein
MADAGDQGMIKIAWWVIGVLCLIAYWVIVTGIIVMFWDRPESLGLHLIGSGILVMVATLLLALLTELVDED